MPATTLAALRRELDHDGCAYGQISRERLSHVLAAVEKIEQKTNYVLAAVGLQLAGFLLSVVLYLLYHLPTK